ncbi:MAG: Spy/CpxP family protein refolding chaperone [Gemmatimonadetes bacterium]|nr:Spy/CpxP family protein refolding chaperone [Gemmatimonadota bacterium]
MKHLIRVGLALGLVAGTAVAQNPPAAPAPAGQPGQRAMMRTPANREQLEQQIRDRIGTQLKNQLKLTDDQFAKLQATNKKFEEKRRLLVEQERDARMGMRDMLLAGDTTNQAKVASALDKMLGIQRQRFELVEQEQKELAGYLSPMQRARFLGIQEQMRRRMEDMRARAGARGQNPGARPMGQGMGQGMRPGMGQPGAGVRQGQRPPRPGARPGAPVPPEEMLP